MKAKCNWLNLLFFNHLFDFVCHVDVHESLKAQQAAAVVTPLEIIIIIIIREFYGALLLRMFFSARTNIWKKNIYE